MAALIRIDSYKDSRGTLTTFGEHLPFAVRRVYFLHSVPPGATRGGHGHKKNRQALVCTSGSCDVVILDGRTRQEFTLNGTDQCLLLEPCDWHELKNFSRDAVLLVLASEPYDPDDFVNAPPS